MAIEIELHIWYKKQNYSRNRAFYLLPHQRRWRTWFPEVIYCTVEVEKARKYIREAIIKGEWKMDDWPEMKHKILKLLSIEDVIIDLAV